MREKSAIGSPVVPVTVFLSVPNESTTGTGRLISKGRWFIFCLVFLLVPFLIIGFGLHKVWEIQEEESVNRLFQRMDSILISIGSRCDTEKYLGGILKKTLDTHNLGKGGIHGIKKRIEALRSRFPGIFRFTVVDENGDVIPRLSDQILTRYVVKKLFYALSVLEMKSDSRELERSWPVVKNFIGPQVFPDQIIAGRSHLEEVSVLDENRWFFSSVSPAGGIFVHVSKPKDWSLLAARDMCRTVTKKWDAHRIKVEVSDLLLDWPGQGSELETLLAEYQKSSQSHFRLEDRLVAITGISPSARITISVPGSRAESFRMHRIRFCILFLMMTSFLSFFSYKLIFETKAFRISTRMRFVFLFVFASGVPLAVIFLAGWEYLNQREKILTRTLHDQDQEMLRAFDERFAQMRLMQANKFNSLLKDVRYGTADEIAETDHVLEMIARDVTEITVYDCNGKIVWQRSKKPSQKQDLEEFDMLAELARNILGQLNQSDEAAESPAAAMIWDNLSVIYEGNPVRYWIRSLGTLDEFVVFGYNYWFYSYPISDGSGKKTHFIFIHWDKSVLENRYISNSLLETQRMMGNIRLFAFNPVTGDSFPPSFRHEKELEPFCRSLVLRRIPTFESRRLAGEDCLLTGIKAKSLIDTYLVSLQNGRSVADEIAAMRRYIYVFGVFVGLMSIFLGNVISRFFLLPIKDLHGGVMAIERRRFDYQIPEGGNDELGDLARTFNTVIAGLSDLQIAGVVQESLFPKTGMVIGNYAISGKTVPASQLGGDYFDYCLIEKERLLFLIGDVSGHGVSAALVMAMAKALVIEASRIAEITPAGILRKINEGLFQALDGQFMFTCIVAILDINSGMLEFSNAGHPPPVVFKSASDPELLPGGSPPLGITDEITFTSRTIRLEKGDTILMYTDGIPETRTENGFLGIRPLIELCAEMLRKSEPVSVETLFLRLSSLSPGSVPCDDMTMLILSVGDQVG